MSAEPREYRMTTHLFGATSSPSCANLALKMTADKYQEKHGEAASEFVRRNFYVDDGLASVATEEEALQLVKTSHALCQEGGFKLHKYMRNSLTVMDGIPSELQAHNIKNFDLRQENLPVERALGVAWYLESDSFRISVMLPSKPPTRRGLLSILSSIYDPLGLVSPVLLQGRKLMQQLFKETKSWDEEVSDEEKMNWERWLRSLLVLKDLQVPRLCKDEKMKNIKRVELHTFSDASLTGCGTCSYIRLIDEENQVSSNLMYAKSRVTPSKPMTVPRLELTAAVTAAQVNSFLVKELDYEEIQSYLWTDSQVALGYIKNNSRRFHMFVANRVHAIRSKTEVDQWNYINSNENPADIASRGIDSKDIASNQLWWKGPPFLMSNNPLPIIPTDTEIPVTDPEVKRVHALHSEVQDGLLPRLAYFSDWNRLKRAVANCRKYINILRNRCRDRKQKTTHDRTETLTVSDLCTAEDVILKAVQEQHFPEEIQVLKRIKSDSVTERTIVKSRIKKCSNLYRLDPFLCDSGIMRIGGWVRRANVPREAAHPKVLPKSSFITTLIVKHFHERTCHSGQNTTLNELRAAGYWILRAKSVVGGFIRSCVWCERLRGRIVEPKMSDLPVDRLEPSPPFTYSGVDFFGPFYVRQGRSERKRWGCLFTCLVSRAIHIEVAHGLSTDSFLNAYRRFVARRGPVRSLRCDRGTNFVGAKNEMESALAEMDMGRIQKELLLDTCDIIPFKMNPPHSSHMGGAWERMIRSIRNVLNHLLPRHGPHLDDELLLTFLAEAEYIVNSRPLTCMDTNDQEVTLPLSPIQLLTLKSKTVLPFPGRFVKQDIYCRKRWRTVQYLANNFWQRWLKEYLPLLQARPKWTKEARNIQVGDVVLLKEEDLPRQKWPLARVVAVQPSEDNRIRKATVKTQSGVYERPVHKMVDLNIRGFPDGEPEEPDLEESDL